MKTPKDHADDLRRKLSGEADVPEWANDAARRLTKELADKGKLIEAGFAAATMTVLKDRPPAELAELQRAFMAGAQHLYASIMVMLDRGEAETPRDLRRMDMIHQELEAWHPVLRAWGRKSS